MNIIFKNITIIFFLFLLISFFSCNKEEKEAELALIYSYIETKKIISDTLPNGMFYSLIDTVSGNTPAKGDTIKTIYKAYFINSKKKLELFEQKTLTSPASYINKEDPVIPGWEYGLNLMANGDSAMFIIPSKLAYKGKQVGIIPPYSPLLFELRIIDIISPTTD